MNGLDGQPQREGERDPLKAYTSEVRLTWKRYSLGWDAEFLIGIPLNEKAHEGGTF